MPLVNLHVKPHTWYRAQRLCLDLGASDFNALFDQMVNDLHWHTYLRPMVRQAMLDIHLDLSDNKTEQPAQVPSQGNNVVL